MSYTLAVTAVGSAGGTNSLTVNAWSTAQMIAAGIITADGQVVPQGTAAPTGTPAATATTAETQGADGLVYLTLPTATTYYIQVIGSDSINRWSYTAEALIGGAVQSVTAGDSSVTVGGTSTAPTVALPAAGTAGTYGDSSHTLTITTDAKGRVTAVTANGVSITHSAITDWATALSSALTGYFNTAGSGLSSSGSTVSLSAVGTAGTSGDASHTLAVTVDGYGRVTGITVNAIVIAQSQVTGLTAALAALAPLASPAFTGSPTAPTQTAGDNSTNLATTAFVANAHQPTTFIGSMITTASVSASGTVFPISPATYPISSGSVAFFNPSAWINGSSPTLAGPVAVGDTSVTVVSALGLTVPAGTEIVPYGAVLPLNTMFPNATVFEFDMMSGGAGGSSGCTGTASSAYAGGPGGSAGALAKAVVLSASTATVAIGYGGYGGSSAAASGHAGVVGSAGYITSVIANGVTYEATTGTANSGGNPGAAPATSATAVSGGGLWMSGATTPNSTTLSLLPGCGGNTGANGSPVPSAWTPGGGNIVSGGGGGGGSASSTKGGSGGTGGGVTNGGAAGLAGYSSTVNGGAGTNGGTNTGSGGGGGGGGAGTTGTSGAGGWGGTGYIIIRAT